MLILLNFCRFLLFSRINHNSSNHRHKPINRNSFNRKHKLINSNSSNHRHNLINRHSSRHMVLHSNNSSNSNKINHLTDMACHHRAAISRQLVDHLLLIQMNYQINRHHNLILVRIHHLHIQRQAVHQQTLSNHHK